MFLLILYSFTFTGIYFMVPCFLFLSLHLLLGYLCSLHFIFYGSLFIIFQHYILLFVSIFLLFLSFFIYYFVALIFIFVAFTFNIRTLYLYLICLSYSCFWLKLSPQDTLSLLSFFIPFLFIIYLSSALLIMFNWYFLHI